MAAEPLQPNRAVKHEKSAIYERIAVDIAKRIANEELAEGIKLSGRTILSGEYGVSPETIRRSFAILEEQGVVAVMQNSGVVVKSRLKAKAFMEAYDKHDESKHLLHRMRTLLEEHEALDREFFSLAKQLFTINSRFAEANPFPIISQTVSQASKVIGRSLGELRFWQETGATVVAVRREGAITLSPGPYFCLQAEDILMMVGPQDSLPRIEHLLQ
ncbi:MAG: TrkA C-terminal domain-containing protein [Sphaerochaeta sp.]|jgi:K+/H+ antiporter YhaU regulatory subunit KhtT|uniref:TrkA C-terminal domain-containing protein n=1 Tax=Sphaerochaeta sp. TaxID=1972642 RepID=UPI00260F57D5|nr:TrkA C-terminal domain-containing protein [Sphaerochaeta sp.]MCK9598655.1 GntR family transcriptional regulator [Sphaerochaeta sp.]MDX9823992.1 TrkA C-terminal domain-containing protein [Sphaerochaeta sp.]